jgi:hypothetical protein
MALRGASRRIEDFRDESLEHIETILHTIVNVRDESPTGEEVAMLRDLLPWWENLAKQMAENRTYWLQGLPEKTQERYQNSKYLLGIAVAIYGPKAV